MAEKTTVDVGIRAKVDEKSLLQAEREFKATSSLGKFGKLADELEVAHDKAGELLEAYGKAAPGARKGIAEQIGVQLKNTKLLTDQINKERLVRIKEIKQLEKLTRTQIKYKERLEEAAKFNTSDMWSGIKDKIIGGLKSGSLKGVISGVGGDIRKGVEGRVARGGLEKAGGVGAEAGIAVIGRLGAVVGVAAAAIAGFAAVVEIVKKASDSMTTLNKALIQGVGYANDMVGDASGYRAVMDEMRDSAIGAHWSMLRFGKSSEDVLKIINSYAKASTGSIVKTRQAFAEMGDVGRQMEQFATSAIVYGRALGMEAEEVASMMGQFQTEMGYGASQVQDLMQDVVKSAATANMPMTKFMEIFKSVTPEVELYRNRLEDLTGTIKLLSKTMSPRDVKQFMDAFSRGFSGVDYKQRLKTVFVAGKGFVDKALEEGFKTRGGSLAKSMGADVGEFQVAMRGGEEGMAALINRLQASGKQLSGTQIGEAMKLASYEATRKKGGELNLATALRGAGIGETYQILKRVSQRFGKGFDGLNEHVIAQLGISNEQYEAMRKTHSSMEIWSDQIQKAGMTSSKSLNEGIARRMMSLNKSVTSQEEALRIFSSLNKEEQEKILFEASAEHIEAMDVRQTMEDLAAEQTTATLSIDDKITNVLGFLLEKIYSAFQPLLDFLDGIYSYLVSPENSRQAVATAKDWTKDYIDKSNLMATGFETDAAKYADAIKKTEDPENKKFLQEQLKLSQESATRQRALAEDARIFGEAVATRARTGGIGDAAGVLDPAYFTKNMQEIFDQIKYGGKFSEMSDKDAAKWYELTSRGVNLSEEDVKWAQRSFGETMGVKGIMELGQRITEEQGPSEEAARIAGYKGLTRRPGTYGIGITSKKSEKDAAAAAAAAAADVAPGFSEKYFAGKGSTGAGAVKAGTGAMAGVLVPTGSPTESVDTKAVVATAETAKVQSDTLTESSKILDNIHTQLMGISMNTDSINKHLDKVQLIKSKFLNEIVGGGKNIRDTLNDVLSDNLTIFLFALLTGMSDGNKKFISENSADLVKVGVRMDKLINAPGSDWGSVGVEKFKNEVDPVTYATMDFGGSIPVTGNYRLQQGEFVSPRGEKPGKSVTVNATINVNGAQDPRAIAVAIREELYRQSERP